MPMALRFAIATVLAISLAGVVQAGDNDKEILQAIKDGQRYLINANGANGGLPAAAIGALGGNGTGTGCLTALALVESGLDGKDKTLAGLARAARQNAMGTNSTYEISLMIMLLDRLGAKEDEGLIQFLTLRLMSGQTKEGGWTYTCGLQLDPVEARQLALELIKEPRLTTPDAPKTPDKKPKPREDIDLGPKTPKKKDVPDAPADSPKPESKPRLHPALEKIAKAVKNGMRGNGFGLDFGCDHSNTQFATVGLWCGRRHGVDVADALAELDSHYRKAQNADGGWTYSGAGGGSTASMTCAGLMGLVMGFGGKDGAKKPDPEVFGRDRAVNDGLKYIGSALATASADPSKVSPGVTYPPNSLSDNLYFMWSLERVGMAYGLKTIGEVDWYEWGSRCLLKSQDRKTGGWTGDGSNGVSAEQATAFALLFLSRANLAEDLTTSLKNKIKDPGTSRLKAGNLDKLPDGGKTTPKSTDVGTTRPKGDNPPIAELDKVGKLAAALVAAEAAQRSELLAQYRDTKGGEYTDALARAAAKLSGEALTQVREALAQRLTRMKSDTLNEMMRDRDREIRRGAALAAASKGKERLPEVAPALVRLIGDEEAAVVQAARATLKSLSGQDFGPELGANAADRGKAVIAWRTWWETKKQ
jgi:hypothetical protein